MNKYTKKPVEIEAIQWTGDNFKEIDDWSSHDDTHYFNTGFEDGEQWAQIYDTLHDTWVNVYLWNFIIRGIKGEFYPCEVGVFKETYDKVVS